MILTVVSLTLHSNFLCLSLSGVLCNVRFLFEAFANSEVRMNVLDYQDTTCQMK